MIHGHDFYIFATEDEAIKYAVQKMNGEKFTCPYCEELKLPQSFTTAVSKQSSDAFVEHGIQQQLPIAMQITLGNGKENIAKHAHRKQ